MRLFAAKTMGGVALSALALLPQTAQADGLALNRFDPAPAGDRLFGVQSASTAGHLVPHVMLMADYAYNPLVLTRNRGLNDVGSVVESQMYLHANASLALWERLTVNVDVPVAVLQDGDSPTDVDGVNHPSPDSAEFGDLRVGLRATIAGDHDDPVALGLGGYLFLPTGAEGSYVSDGAVRGSVELLLSGVADWFYYGLAVGPDFRSSKQFRDIDQGTMMSFGGGLGVLLGDEKQVQLGPEVDVNITLSDVRPRNTNAELRLGAKYRFLDDFVVGAAAGPGIAPGVGTPDVRAIGMFAYSPSLTERVTDGDGDGVADSADACPQAAGVPNANPEQHGCPPPPDRDGDGVADAQDLCPDDAAPAGSADPNRPGCPAVSDRDGDGFPDVSDACPDVTAPAPGGDPQRPGCPKVGDRDNDGFPDPIDSCPDVAAPANISDPKKPGCPKDQDGDGVPDAVDACPTEAGPAQADPNKSGCPSAVRVTATSIDILQKVEFATGTARIEPTSNGLLDEVAQVLKDHAELLKIEVRGHTDNRGPGRVNTRLSQQRADAVSQALVARGVEAGRLTTKGFGPDKPIASNDTDEGRSENRRVEFAILERKAK